MKKITCTLLIIFMLTAMLSGCGGAQPNVPANTASAEPTSQATETPAANTPDSGAKDFANKNLVVYAFEGGFGREFMEKVVTNFEMDYPGVKVDLTMSPKIDDMIKPMFLAGNPPDFAMPLFAAKYATDGALRELNDVFDSKCLDKDMLIKDIFPEGMLTDMQPLKDGKFYWGLNGMGISPIWYNKVYFKDKGLTPPKTIDEFWALGEAAKADGKALYAYQGMYPGYNNAFLFPLIASTAGDEAIKKIVNYEEGAWLDPNVQKAMQVFVDIKAKGYLMPGTVAMDHKQSQTEFLKGQALFIPNGTWFAAEMADAVPADGSFEFGCIAPPVLQDGNKRYIIGGGGGIRMIPKDAKNPELAVEFLKYMYTDKIVTFQAQIAGEVAPVKGGIELAKPYIHQSIYEAFKLYDEGVTPISFDNMWMPVAKGETVVMLDEIQNPMTSVFNGEMTVQQWSERIEAATAKIRANLAKQ